MSKTKFKDENPEMKCLDCGHPRSKHRTVMHHKLPDVRDCTLCNCDKFYPEKFSYLNET
uniref:Uncharacterized protein n=1 Tax=viral metagenome TaxID=1070528 RepID=A0A6M3J6I4_9ZZZZ